MQPINMKCSQWRILKFSSIYLDGCHCWKIITYFRGIFRCCMFWKYEIKYQLGNDKNGTKLWTAKIKIFKTWYLRNKNRLICVIIRCWSSLLAIKECLVKWATLFVASLLKGLDNFNILADNNNIMFGCWHCLKWNDLGISVQQILWCCRTF